MEANNYQIEDLENEACKKSNIAKRVAAGAAMLGAGAGAAFAADRIVNSEEAAEPGITPDELVGVVTDGVTEDDMPAAEEPVAETPRPDEVHVYHHVVEEKPAEPEVEFNQSTTIVNEDGDVVASIDEGTIDGNNFAAYDIDGDGKADYFAYDANNNKVYESDEIIDVQGEDINMHGGEENIRIVVNTDNNGDWYIPDGRIEEDDLSDITNDFTHEKTGETYGDDLAENNDDYNNDGDVRQYASIEEEKIDGSEGYAVVDEEYTGDGGYSIEGSEEYATDEEIVNDLDGMPDTSDDIYASDDFTTDEVPNDFGGDDLSQYDLV